MNARETGAMLGVSERTVRRLARAGQIPHRRIPGVRRLIFDRDAVNGWIADQVRLCNPIGPADLEKLRRDFPGLFQNGDSPQSTRRSQRTARSGDATKAEGGGDEVRML